MVATRSGPMEVIDIRRVGWRTVGGVMISEVKMIDSGDDNESAMLMGWLFATAQLMNNNADENRKMVLEWH